MSTRNPDEPPKHAEKSTMQEPQEEFIADASVPSHSGTPPPKKQPSEGGEEFDEKLTKAEASRRTDEPRKKADGGL